LQMLASEELSRCIVWVIIMFRKGGVMPRQTPEAPCGGSTGGRGRDHSRF